jgi:hypothetical protein
MPASSDALPAHVARRRKWPFIFAALAVSLAAAFYFLSRPVDGITVRGIPSCANCTVLAIAKALPEFQRELDAALKEENIGADDMICSGKMLGRSWGHLSYGEVTPFYCTVGNRSLIVDGGNHYLDADGRRLTSYDQAMYDNAMAVDHPLPHWTWK